MAKTPAQIEREIAGANDLREAKQDILALDGESLKILQESNVLDAQRQAIATDILNQRREIQAIAESELVTAKHAERMAATKVERHKATIERLKAEKDLNNELVKTGVITATQAKELNNLVDKRVKQEEKSLQLATEAIQLSEQLGKSFANNLKLSTKSNFSTQGLVDKFSNLGKVMKDGPEAIMKMLTTAALSTLTTFVDNIVNLAVDLYDVEKGFQKATGASEDFAREVTNTYEATRLYGVSAQEASEATQSLYTNFTDFTMIGADARAELTETAGVLQELGVSFDSYANSVQTATKALGVATDQADDMMRELTAHAMDMGVPVGQLTQQFAQMSPQLAKLGSNAVQSFKDMARVSKITGLEMNKLLQITNKFDTFEGAAEQAGKLNAALGGNFVNAMDLMMTEDPVERFSMIRDSILDAGLSFDEMSYYQRQFYTESLGLSEVADLAKLMSGDFEALDGDIGKTSDDYEEMAKRAANVQKMQESFQNLLAEFTPIITPIIDGLASFVGWIVEFVQQNKKAVIVFVSIVTAVGSIGLAFKTLLPLAALMGGWMPMLIGGAKLLGAAFLALNWPLIGTVAGITAVIAAVSALAAWFFSDDVGASTFLEGIHKISDGFASVGEMADLALAPVKALGAVAGGVGSAIGGAMDAVGDWFGGDDGDDTTKRMEAATLGATTGAPAAAARTAAATKGAAAGGGAAVTKPPDEYNVTLQLTMDGKIIDEKVERIVGGIAKNAALGTA